jgi:putative transposase
MLEWLCNQMMEAEVSNKVGAEKHEQSKDRTSHCSGYRSRRIAPRIGYHVFASS